MTSTASRCRASRCREKLDALDRHAPIAVAELIAWLQQEASLLCQLARGRLVAGHYRYGDRGLRDLDADELLGEAAEELADAIVYMSFRAQLGGRKRK
jgi:hypothetical protein